MATNNRVIDRILKVTKPVTDYTKAKKKEEENKWKQDNLKTQTDLPANNSAANRTNNTVADRLLGMTERAINGNSSTTTNQNNNKWFTGNTRILKGSDGPFFGTQKKETAFSKAQDALTKGVQHGKTLDTENKWLSGNGKKQGTTSEQTQWMKYQLTGAPNVLKNPQEYAEYVALNRKYGTKNDNIYEMSDEQLGAANKEYERLMNEAHGKAEERSAAGKDKLNENIMNAADRQTIYDTLATKGVPYFTNFEGDYVYTEPSEYYKVLKDENYIKARPEGYDPTLYNDYDKAIYDTMYGQGAYDNIVNNGTDEEIEAMDAEIAQLWDKVENGGFEEDRAKATDEYFNSIEYTQDDFGEQKYKKGFETTGAEMERRNTIRELEENAPEGEWGYDSSKEYKNIFSTPDSADQVYIYSNIDLTAEDLTDFQRLGKLQPAQFMTKEQKNTFYGYYLNGDKESAQAYYDGLKDSLMSIRTQYRNELEAQMAEDPLYGTIMKGTSILTKPTEGLTGAAMTLMALGGNKDVTNPNSEVWDLTRSNRTARTTSQRQWGEKFREWFGDSDFAQKAGETLNGVFYSMADMLMATALGGGAGSLAQEGISAAIAEGTIQFIMSSEATASTMLEQMENGKDPTEAALYAVGSGVIEALTEKYSIEALLKPNVKELLGDWKQFAKYLAKNFITEGSEEVASDIANTLLDGTLSLIYGHEDEIIAEYNELMATGKYSEEEATRIVLMNKLDQLGTSFVSGALSGLLLSGARGLETRTEVAIANRNAGKQMATYNVAENATQSEKSSAEAVNRVGLVNIAKDMGVGTESRELGEKAYNDIMKGKKVSDADIGAIARALLNDTNGSIQASVSNILQERISEQMEEMGEKPENIEANAASLVNLIAGTATDADMVRYLTSESMKKLLSQYRMSNEGIGEKRAEVEEETQKAESIRETVSAMIAPRAEVSTKAIENVVKDAKVATQDEINKAEGKVTGNPLQVVTDGKIKEIAETKLEGDGDGKHIQVYFTDGTNADIADVKATNIGAAQVLEFANLNGNKTTSDAFTNALLRNVTKEENAAALISGAMRIRWDVVTGQKTYNSGLDAKTSGELRTAAEADYAEAEARRLKNYRQINPGKGKTTYNGVAYGTKAFQEAIKGLSRDARTEAVTIGALAKSAGFDVELINDPNSTKEQGSYSANGGIVINLAGEYRDGVRRSALATLPHEITHWLEGNSPEAYKALRQFVLNTQKANGVNLEQRLQNIMDSYAKENVNLDMFDAVSEMVAKSCEEVLTDESVIRRLRESDPNTYGKVRKAVSMAITRVKEALGMAKATSSIYAQTIRDYADKLSDLWVKAYEEAKQVKGTGTVTDTQGNEYSFAGTDPETGRSVYISNYEEGTPKSIKQRDLINTIQNVFSKNPIELEVTDENGITKTILAQFDPDFDETGERQTDVGKLIYNKKTRSNPENRVRLNVAGDLQDMMRESKQYDVQPDYKGNTENKRWYYFNDDFYYVAQGSNIMEPYKMDIIVREKENGDFVYTFEAIKDTTAKEKKLSLMETVNSVNSGNNSAESASTSNNSITQQKKNSNSQRSIQESDAEYMKAVENGDEETQQRIVEAAAEKAMPNSKMRTADGKLRVLYHGTWSDTFTEFDPKWIGTAREGDTGFYGRGFYFAYSKGEASFYGGNVMDVYLNITNPFNYRKEFHELDGMETNDYNASRAVFVVNFAEKFPELANNHTVEVYEKGSDEVKELSLKEFADEYRRIVKEKKFKVEKVDGYDGEEWVASTDKKMNSYTNENGETFTWPEYGYQKRFYSEKDAKNQLTNAYEYMANTVYDHISIQNPTIIIMESDFSKSVQARGYDGIIQSEDGDEAVAFDSSQIKLADPVTYDDNGNVIPPSERFNEKKTDIRYSVQENDADYMAAVNSGNMEEAQADVDRAAEENGYTIRAFHGTGRADRVGTVFLPERATSGPMAFFTDSREIAENYASGKKDTSIAYDEEYGDYHTQFRYNLNGKNIPVSKLWDKLGWQSRQKIIEAAKHINFDDELENIIYDENAQYGPGGFTDNELRYHKGNAIDTLIYVWLESANLWNREEDFLKVLEMAGIKGVTWNNPDARVEKVYDTYLKIQNPFVVNDMYNEEFLKDLQEWWDEQDQSAYVKESMGADFWDKNNVTVDEWIEDAYDEIKRGVTHNWTRIPDGVSAYLEEKGYDGIKDQGGKNGGIGHTVWIPFSSEQIKSAETITYDDDGNIIPPSERFNPEKKDIRWSIQDETEGDIRYWMMSVKPESLQTEAEKELLNHFKDVQTRLDLRNIQIGELKEKIRRLESKETLNKDEKRLLAKWKIQLENAMTVKKSAEEELGKIVGSEGYGRMMKRQNRIFNDFMYGKTQAEVEEEIRGLQTAADNIAREIAENKRIVDELSKKDSIKAVKEILEATKANDAAGYLKRKFNSSWTKTQLRTYIDPILALAAKQNLDDPELQQRVRELAEILVESDTTNTYETIQDLRGITITIGKGAQKELRATHRSINDIRDKLAGTGIKVRFGDNSNLDTDTGSGGDLRSRFPDMPEITNDLDAIDQFVDWVNGMRGQENLEFFEEKVNEAYAEVMAQAAAVAAAGQIYKTNDPKARQQIAALIDYIRGLDAKTEAAEKTLERIQKDIGLMTESGNRAAGLANVLTTNIGDALEYYDRTAKMALATAKKERNTQIIEQLKSENAQKIAKNNEEWRNLIERDKQAQRQAENNRVYRSRINTALKRTFNLLKNPKGMQNIPEYMQGLARELLETFVDNDLNEMRMQKITLADKGQLEEAKRLLEAWKKQDGEFNMADLNEAEDAVASVINMDLMTIYNGIAQLNGEIRGKNKLDTMTQRGEILRQVQEAVSEIYSAIRTEGKIQVNRRMIDVQDQAYRIATELNGKNRKEWTGKIGNVMNVLHKGIVSGNMTPEYFFRTIGNAGLSELWNNYHDAENRNGLELKKAQTRLAEIAEKHGYEKWDMKQKITLPLESGDVTLTLGQLMSLWATWKRENTLGPAMSEHLTKGGFYAEEDTRDGLLGRRTIEKKAHRVTEADMQRVEAMLTDEQLAFIDDVVGYMSTDMSELGNEASMAAYGIKMYKEGYYFPFQMWDGIRSRKSNDSGSAAAAQDRAFHPSFSKSRLHGANNALVIGDFMQTAADHIAGMINYATMGLANESLQKTLNLQLQENEDAGVATKRNVWTMMEEAYGQEAMQYLRELQKQLNGGAVKIDKTFYDKLISLFRKNAVAGSLSVAAQQPLSYIRAAMMINPKYLAQALNPVYWKGSYKEMLAHSGVAVIKDMGRFDMNFGQSAREFLMPDGLESTGRKVWEGIKEYSTILPEKMDRMTWTRMWSAVKAEQKALHPEMDVKSDEFLDLCGERFNDIMRRTQVYDSVLVKSANMRSQNPFMKTLTSFMAEPTLTLNVLADSVRMAKNGEAGGKAMVGKAAATFILSAILQAFVKGIMGSGRTPDEKKTWLENFMYKFEYNFLNEIDVAQLVPGFSDAITLLKGGEMKDDALNTIKKMIDAYGKIGDILNGGGWRAVEDSIGQIVQMYSGVPMKNLMRDGRAMWNWFIDQPYADRETSGAVLKGQTTDLFFNADNMLGVVNKWLGDAGYDTSNMGYYEQIYNAKKRGDEQAELDLIDYLINGKGIKAETIESKVNSIAKKDESLSAEEKAEFLISQGSDSADDYIRDQLKQGNMTAAEARKELKKAQPDKDENEIWWTVDRIEYAKETGNKVSGNSYYYRLEDAINSNSANAIKAAVQELTAHGVPKDNVKKKLSDWKKAYLSATGNEKVRIKNALIMAYKALGFSETEANEIINKWK